MDNLLIVAVLYGINDRSDSLSGFLLAEVLLGNNNVEKLSPQHDFQDEVVVFIVLEDVEQPADIRVVNVHQYLDLILKCLSILIVQCTPKGKSIRCRQVDRKLTF